MTELFPTHHLLSLSGHSSEIHFQPPFDRETWCIILFSNILHYYMQYTTSWFRKIQSTKIRRDDAEKSCWHFNMGLVQFSPELNFWRKQWDLWKLLLWCKAGFPVKAKYINCLAHSCQIQNPFSASHDQATKKTTSLLKCYLSISDAIKKTHTGSIYWGSSYGGKGLVTGWFFGCMSII